MNKQLFDVIDEDTGVHLTTAIPLDEAQRKLADWIAAGWKEAAIIDAYGYWGSLSPDRPAEGWSGEYGPSRRPK